MSVILTSSGSVDMEIKNSANNTVSPGTGANSPASIYIGVNSSLQVTLTNNTGSAISVASTDEISVRLPFFLNAYQKAISLTDISAKWKVDPSSKFSLQPASGTTSWNTGEQIDFTLSGINVPSTANPNSSILTVSFTGLALNSVNQHVSLEHAPKKGNLNLHDAVSVTLLSNKLPYPNSTEGEKLFLTITNILPPPHAQDPQPPLSTVGPGKAEITISFVYGDSVGSINTATEAQKFTASVKNDQGNGWALTSSPSSTSSDAMTAGADKAASVDPQWSFAPSAGNTAIIGGGQNNSIEFEFDKIKSNEKAGTTLMYVSFNGFEASATKGYNDTYFILPIHKINTQPTITGFSVSSTEKKPFNNVLSYNTNNQLNTTVFINWLLTPPSTKTVADYTYYVQIKSKSTDHQGIIPYDVLEGKTPGSPIQVNLTDYCSWDLTNETGLDFTFHASLKGPVQSLIKKNKN